MFWCENDLHRIKLMIWKRVLRFRRSDSLCGSLHPFILHVGAGIPWHLVPTSLQRISVQYLTLYCHFYGRMVNVLAMLLVVALVLTLTRQVQCFVSLRTIPILRSTRLRSAVSAPPINGRLVVTGTEQVADDEFLLGLLHEQGVWSTVTLATDDASEARKRLLTRSSRYSGLLNVLDVSVADITNESQLKGLLQDCSAWLAFNVTEDRVAQYTSTAINAGVKRAIFTLELSPEHFNRTEVPALDAANKAFKAAGGAFTGIRYGTVVPGNEDFAYQIVNATEACVADTVRRGVLARVVTEMLRGNATHHAVCGLSSSGRLANEYLSTIRGMGLSRQEEVEKIFQGGVQKFEINRKMEEQEEQEDPRIDDSEEGMSQPMESDEERLVRLSEYFVPTLSIPPGVTVFDQDDDEPELEDQESDRDHQRARALEDSILQHAYLHRDTGWNISREDFDEVNRDNAMKVAQREVWSWRELQERDEVKRIASRFEDVYTIADEERLQLARLLSLRHGNKSPRSQKLMSDVWVRYIYLILERTTSLCLQEGVCFEDLKPHEQTLLLRCQANELRALGNLPAADLLCDPVDALQVVDRLSRDAALSAQLGLHLTTSEIVSHMRAKYSGLLHSVPTLEQVAQILKSSISTLRQSLLPKPNRKVRKEPVLMERTHV